MTNPAAQFPAMTPPLQYLPLGQGAQGVCTPEETAAETAGRAFEVEKKHFEGTFWRQCERARKQLLRNALKCKFGNKLEKLFAKEAVETPEETLGDTRYEPRGQCVPCMEPSGQT